MPASLKPVPAQKVKRNLEAGRRIVVQGQGMASVRLQVDLNGRRVGEDLLLRLQIVHPFAISRTDEKIELRQHVMDRPCERPRSTKQSPAGGELGDWNRL